MRHKVKNTIKCSKSYKGSGNTEEYVPIIEIENPKYANEYKHDSIMIQIDDGRQVEVNAEALIKAISNALNYKHY